MSDAALRRSKAMLATAKWGAACSSCSVAKAKCIRSDPSPGSKCDRCDRLHKHCAAQVHKVRKKRQVKPSRTAQIEKRLNGLVNILKTSGELSKANLGAIESLGVSFDSDQSTTSRQSSVAPESDAEWSVPATYNSYAPNSCICRPETGDAPPPPGSDEALLAIYRDELLVHHPFVVIDPDISAETLGETRPFLMSSIRMVASFRSMRSMRAQMYHLMKHLSDHMLVRSERSLDLLLGTIVILGWYQYHCFFHAQLSNLVALATSLVCELGLNKPPMFTPHLRVAPHGTDPSGSKTRANEERRALAGVWFLSSSMSMGFGKTESTRYTCYLDECLKDLESNPEYDTDVDLIHLVRIQSISERLHQLNTRDFPTAELPRGPQPPRAACILELQAEIDQLRQGLPTRLRLNNKFMTNLMTASLQLYEPPAINAAFIRNLMNAIETPSQVSHVAPIDELYRSRAALLAWFENWFSIPTASYYCQTTATYYQVQYAISMLGRWARLLTPTTLSPYPSTSNSLSVASRLSPRDVNLCQTPSTAAASPLRSEASMEKEPCRNDPSAAIMLTNGEVDRDLKLPKAVASLRAKLEGQPGLHIDVSEILETIYSRLEQASVAVQQSAVSSERKDPNVFSMGAVKVLFARSKWERWGDIVSAGTAALSLEDKPMADDAGFQGQGGAMFASELINMPDLTEIPWMTDMMQDDAMSAQWFDGYLDWGSVIMSSIENGER